MDKQILPQSHYLLKAVHTLKAHYPEYAARLNGRLEKAYALAASGYVRALGFSRYAVRSSDRVYIVELCRERCACDCADNKRTEFCKHVLAARFASQAESSRWADLEFEMQREQAD